MARRAAAQDVPSANPSRPTVTNATALPPTGYLQFEQGYIGSFTSPQTTTEHGVVQASKIAVLPRLLAEVAWQPYGATLATGTLSYTSGLGDVDAGGQVLLYSAPAPSDPAASKPLLGALAIAYLGRVHAGTTGSTDQGSYSNSVNLLVGGDHHGWHYDANFLFNAQSGASLRGNYSVRRPQFAQTFYLEHGLGATKFAAEAEIYHFTQPLVFLDDQQRAVADANAIDGLFAGLYNARPNLIFDAGLTRGLTSTSTRWQAFAGVSYLLPKRLIPNLR